MGAVGTGTGQGRRALLMCCAQLFPSPLAPGPGRYAKAILPIAWLGKLRLEIGSGFPTAAAMSQCPGAGVINPTSLYPPPHCTTLNKPLYLSK